MLIDKSIYSTDTKLPEEQEETHPLASELGSHYLLSEDYVYGEDKNLVANQAFMHWASDQEAEKKGTVKAIGYEKNDAGVLEKVEKDFPMFNGESLTSKGQEEYERVKRYFDGAASMPNGGVSRNPATRKWEVDRRLESVFTEKQEKRPDPFKDMSEFINEQLKITPEGDSPAYTYEDYTGFHNAGVKNGEAQLDPSNKEMKKRFSQEVNRRTFDPSFMDDTEIGQKVSGAYVINPKNYSEVDKVESWIDGLTDLSASDKKMMLIDYRSKIEANVGTLVNDFAAADAGVIGGIFSSPLRDEFNEYMSKPGASGYQFLKDNKERMSKDSYGATSEIATKFRDSVMATGTGFLWAASAGNYTSPAEAWGGLAEDSSKAYSNGKVFEVFGVDINRRDLTELTGQIGSFVAMGGMGALAGKGLTAIGAQGASRYAVNEAGILLSTVARTEAAAAAGTRTLGQKTLAGLKAAGTDPEMYLGSLQAAGTSFGKTFNSTLEETGSREEALKAANIDAISDGFSAFIATGVMNRFAPGMGKALGMGDGEVGGGIVQAFKNKALARESMEQVQTVLNNLKGKIGEPLRKQFANDIGSVMSASARSLGLKGIGIFGNMGAEAVEEASDEIISDVISSMLDDSKTWNEEVWQNIGTKWKEYVKAGVLGAIGGAMGDASGTLMSPKETFGTSEGLKLQTKEWDRIKTNVKQFESMENVIFPAPIQDAKNLAEYIAMPDGKVSIQQKSDALLAAVRGKTLLTSIVNANVPVVDPVTDAEPSATNIGATPSADTGSATTTYKEGSLGHFMEKIGVPTPKGKTWKADIMMTPHKTESFKNNSTGDSFSVTPLSIASTEENGSVTANVGAKIETTTKDGTTTIKYASAEEAANFFKDQNRPKDAKGFVARAESETEYDEWQEDSVALEDGPPAEAPAASTPASGTKSQPEASGASLTPSGDILDEVQGDVRNMTREEFSASAKSGNLGKEASGKPDVQLTKDQEAEIAERFKGASLQAAPRHIAQGRMFGFEEADIARFLANQNWLDNDASRRADPFSDKPVPEKHIQAAWDALQNEDAFSSSETAIREKMSRLHKERSALDPKSEAYSAAGDAYTKASFELMELKKNKSAMADIAFSEKLKAPSNENNSGTAAEKSAPTSDVQDKTSDDIDPLEALLRELELKDSEPENNTIGSSETGTTDVFSYKQKIAKEVAAIAGYLPAPKEKKTGGTTIIPSGPVIYMGSLNQERVSAIVDRVLTQTEKLAASRALKENSWNDSAKKKFGERMADWMVSGKEFNSKLIELFKKVWKAITLAGIAGAVAVSPMSDRNNVSVVTISPESLNPSTLVNPNIKPTSTVINAPLEGSEDYDSSTKANIIVSKEDSSIGTTPTRTSPKFVSANFDGAEYTTNVRVVANWVLQNTDNKGLPFSVADKQGGTVYFFDSKGNLTIKTPALFGKMIGDYTSDEILAKDTDKISDKEKITPAGRFETYNKTSTTGNGVVAIYRVGAYTDLAFHKVYLKQPKERRLDRLASKTGADNRISHGCINLPTEVAKKIIPLMGGGSVTYILPETKAGKETFDGFKDLVIPSDSNNLALNEAGLDPLSAFLMAMAGMALAKKRKGASRTEIQEEINSALAESRLSDQKKEAALVRLNNVLDQSFSAKQSPEKTKQQPTTTKNEQQNDANDGSNDGSKIKTDDGSKIKTDDETDAKEVGKKDDQKEGVLIESKAAGASAPVASISKETRRIANFITNTNENIRFGKVSGKPSEVEFQKDENGNDTGVAVKSNGEVWITDERLASIAEENGNNKGKTIAAVEVLFKLAGSVKFDALPIENVPDVQELVSQDITYVVSKKSLESGETDLSGGKWTRTASERGKASNNSPTAEQLADKAADAMFGTTDTGDYFYTPPKGSRVSLKEGDVVLIESVESEVLVLDRIENGQWVYRRVQVTGDLTSVMTSRQKQRVFEWNVNRLIASSALVKSNLGAIKSGQITDAAMKSIFMEIVNLVAPGYKGKVVEKVFGKDSARYLSADIGSGNIQVDYKNLNREFKSLLQHANLSNDVTNEALATDVARVMGKMVDEEVIHILAAKSLGKTKSNELYRNVWKMGAKSPMFKMMVDTAKERFPDLNPDPTNTTDDNIFDEDNAAFAVVAEVIRKIHQLSTTGSTTEGAINDSYILQAAIIRDLGKDAGIAPGRVTKFVNMVKEMVRRYSNRVNNILQMRWQQGRLPFDQQEILAKLNKAYRNQKIQGDFDYAQEATEQRVNNMEREAVDSYTRWVNDVAREHYEAINELKALPSKFPSMKLDKVLMVDNDTMTLRINPTIRALIEKYNLLDLGAVDEALAFLNTETKDENGNEIYAMSSYRQAMTVAFSKKQVMEAKLAKLDPELVDLVTGMMVGGEGNIDIREGRESQQGNYIGRVLRLVEKAIGTNDYNPAEQLLSSEHRRLRQNESVIRDQISFIKKVITSREMQDVESIDVKTFNGRIKLMRVLAEDYPGIEVDAIDENIRPDEMVRMFESLRQQLLRKIKLKSLQSIHLIPKDGVGRKSVDFDSKSVKEEWNNLSDLRKALGENLSQQREVSIEFGKVSKAAIDDSIKLVPVSHQSTEYGKLIDYIRSVDEYNTYLKNIINRSLGDFFFNKGGFGVTFANITKTEGVGAAMTFPEYSDTLPTATTASEVFGAEFKQKGSVIAFHEKRPFAKDGEELSEEQIELRDEIELIIQKAKSNSAFVGRQHFNRAYMDWMLGNFAKNEDYDLYLDTGGFDLKKTEDENDSDRYRVESPELAFKSLNLKKFKDLRRFLSNQRGAKTYAEKPLIEFINEIKALKAWAEKIQSTVGGGMVAEIAGRQTLAGRIKLAINDQFSSKSGILRVLNNSDGSVSEKNVIKGKTSMEIDGLVPLLTKLDRQLTAVIERHLVVTQANDLVQSTKLKTDSKPADLYAQLSAVVYGEEGNEMSARLESANETVQQIRAALKEFKDLNWRRNYEREGSMIQRSDSFEPDNIELLELRNSPKDTRIYSNFLWLTSYHEKTRDYYVSSNFAFEMMQEYATVSYGEGRLPELYTNKKWQRVYLDKEAIKIFNSDFYLGSDGRRVSKQKGTHPSVPSYSKIEYDTTGDPLTWNTPQGNVFYMKAIAVANPTGSATNPNTFDADPRSRNSYDDTVEMLQEGSSLTQAESMLNRSVSGVNGRRYWITKWGMTIGANSEGEFSGKAASTFLDDLLRAERNGISRDDRIDLIQRGLVGLFPKATGFGEEAKREFFKGLYEQFEAAQKSSTFQSLFPEQIAKVQAKTAELKAFYNDNAEKVAKAIENRFDSEQFLFQLGEFKAGFERELLSQAKTGTSLGEAIRSVTLALPTEEMVDVEEEVDVEKDIPNPLYTPDIALGSEEDSPFASTPKNKEPKTIKGKVKEKRINKIPKSKLQHNSFSSPEETTAIKSFLESLVTTGDTRLPDGSLQSNAPVYNASLMVGGVDGVGNPFVSMLVQSLPGKTLVVNPTEQQVARNGLAGISLKVFIGAGNAPNVIYAPQGQTSPELSSGAAHGAIAQLLTIASKNKLARAEIDRLGRAIEETLDPVFMIEGLYNDLSNGRAKWTSRSIQEKLFDPEQSKSLRSGTNLDNVFNQFSRNQGEMREGTDSVLRGATSASMAYKVIEPRLSHLTTAEKKRFRKDLAAHIIKLSEYSSSLGIVKKNGASISLFPKRTALLTQKKGESDEKIDFDERGTTSRIMLIAELMSNPSAKRYFDKAYVGIDEIGNTLLPRNVEEGLADALRNITRLDNEREMFDSERVDEAQSNSNELAGKEDDTNDDEADIDFNETRADNDAIEKLKEMEASGNFTAEMQDEMQRLMEGVSEREAGGEINTRKRTGSYGPNVEAINSRLREMLDIRQAEDAKAEELGLRQDPSNVLLFNGIARVLEFGKLATGETYEGESEVRSVDNILNYPDTTNDNTKAMVGPLWKQFGDKRPSQIYVGEMRNLTLPKSNGQTAHNIGFSKTRLSRAQAAILLATRSARSLIESIASEQIAKTLRNSPFTRSFPRIEARIQVTDQLVSDLDAMLPDLGIKQIEQELRDSLELLDNRELDFRKEEVKALDVLHDLHLERGRLLKERRNKRIKELELNISIQKGRIENSAKSEKLKRVEVINGIEVPVNSGILNPRLIEGLRKDIVRMEKEIRDVEYTSWGDISGLEYADYESISLRRQTRDLVVAHVKEQVSAVPELLADATNMGMELSTTMRQALRNSDQIQYNYNSAKEAFDAIVNASRIFDSAFEAENAGLIPDQTSTVILEKAKPLIEAYNLHVGILNAVIEFYARKSMQLHLRDGASRTMPVHRLKMVKFDKDSSLLSEEVTKAFDSFRSMTNVKKGIEAFFDMVVGDVVAGVAPGASNETNKFIRSVAKAYAKNPEIDLDAYVEEQIGKALNDEFESEFKAALDEIALSTSESRNLIENRTMTDGQLEAIKKAEKVLLRARNGIKQVRKEIAAIENNDGQTYVGQGYFQGKFGSPAVSPRPGRSDGFAGVHPDTRTIGTVVFLAAPEMNVQRAVEDTDETFADKLEEWSKGWKDIAPDEGQLLTPEEVSENARRRVSRREHYIRAGSVFKALSSIVNDYVDDAYRIARGTDENFNEFNPLKVIQEGVDFAKAEQAAANRFFENAMDDSQAANNAGLHVEAIALLTNPKDTNAMKLLTSKQRGSLKILRIPDNHSDRVEKVGRLFEMDGEMMVLLPKTASERLMQAYPREITKQNVNSSLVGIVFDAVSISQRNKSTPTSKNASYFLNGTEQKRTETFDGGLFSLTKANLKTTKDEAAKLFRSKWQDSMQNFLNDRANLLQKKSKKVDLSGEVSQAAIADAGFQLELLVIAHGDPNLSDDTRLEIYKLLESIDEGAIDAQIPNLFGTDFSGINSVRILATFSKAFSEIEAAAIQKRIIAGMSLTGKGHELQLSTLQLLHHQDGRIRHRALRDHSAREANKHLIAFLDYGINIETGRRGYNISKKKASDRIGYAAEKVGNNSMNQTIGYLLAVVRGIDNANGMSKLNAMRGLIRVMGKGFEDLDQFVAAQEKFYKNDVTKYWNGHSLDLGRDMELSIKIRSIIKKGGIRQMVKDAKTEEDAVAAQEWFIKLLQNAVEDGKSSEVEHYSKELHSVMTDIHNAMLFTTAVLSQDAATDVSEKNWQDWRDSERRATRPTYSSVPLRLSYAAHPDPTDMGQDGMGRYVSDPAEIVSFKDASFFGGIGRNEVAGIKKNVFRPIAINGLSSPLALIDDSLYRLNVTPTYEVLRRSFGKTTTNHNIPIVEDGLFLEKVKLLAPDDIVSNTYLQDVAVHDREVLDFQKAMAGITSELEIQIQNDAALSVDNTGGAEALRFLGSAYIVRALASPLQIWDQTISPSMGYTAGKLVSGKPKMAATYFKIIGKLLSSLATDRKFWRKVRKFIEQTEPAVFYRASDGQDVSREMIGNQVRYGDKKVKNFVGKGLRKYEQFGERVLDLTIGSGERVIASSLFLTELMNELENMDKIQKGDLDAMLEMKPQQIPMIAKNNARVKVNDLMSQSDQSKKAEIHQTKTSNPNLNALMKSLTRFSNHTSGMASNVSVLSMPAIDPLLAKFDSRKWGHVDKESQQEAMEVVVQTLVQNILFYPMKLKIMIPFILSIIFNSWGDDDDDKAVRRAQELANDLMAPTDDGTWYANTIKSLVFGKKRELFQSNKSDEAARSSALAEVMTKSVLEGFQLIPVFGSAAGYSPVSSLLQKVVTDPLSESTSAMLTGVKKAVGPYAKDYTNIRNYEKGWDENIASVTAPTQMVYDMSSAMKLMLEYQMTSDAQADRGMSLFNSAVYLASEVIPGLRELRSHMKDTLKQSGYKDN